MSPRADDRLQLVRELTSMALDCVISEVDDNRGTISVEGAASIVPPFETFAVGTGRTQAGPRVRIR